MQRGSLQVSALHKSTKIRQLCVCVFIHVYTYIYVYMYVYSIVHIHAEYVYNIYILYIYMYRQYDTVCVYECVEVCSGKCTCSVACKELAQSHAWSKCMWLPAAVSLRDHQDHSLLKNVVQTCSNRLTYPRAIKHGNGKRQIYWMIFIDFPCKTPVGVDFPACHVWLTESTIYIPVHWDDSGNHGKTTAFQCCKPICGRL